MMLENIPSSAPEPVQPRFAIDYVWKSFGDVAALSGAPLHLLPGEIHALIGENGAGKNTLINIATGVHRPDRDHILRRCC